MRKLLRTLLLFALFIPFALTASAQDAKKKKGSGAWSDIKGGFRGIVRGATKGVQSAADKVQENLDEDEREDRAEAKKKSKKR